MEWKLGYFPIQFKENIVKMKWIFFVFQLN